MTTRASGETWRRTLEYLGLKARPDHDVPEHAAPWNCDRCGAMVQTSSRELHRRWHRELEGR
ncbi:hypothetical protein [Ornithinimicrobium sp. Y1694]|uniref:hypothetical protein n=1 Tax=Ornithinimicrobium sp. Y1694 TaxID=3418590 RepID=UPI003CE7DDAE